MLSPHWFDFTWIFLLSLIPSVGLIAYYHGKSGMDKWVKAERIFIPANLAITIIILFFLFEGKDLGATTREVTVEDEQGNTIQRIIPKNEFIRNIAIFNFENYTDNPKLDWLSTGINIGILADLEQDKFFQPRGTESFYDEIKRAKIEDINQVPFALKRNIAKELRLNYFLAGSFDEINEGYQINTQLFETDNGKLIAEHTFEGLDLFILIDQLTVTIKEDLQLPSSYIETAEDLAVSNLLTRNLGAMENFTMGFAIASFDKDYAGSIQHMLNAVEKDPDFIIANLNLSVLYLMNNQMNQASIYIDKVIEKLYLLPERDQFMAKSFYYYVHEEQDKRIKVVEMWIELYPDDVDAYNLMTQIYRVSGEPGKAEQVLKAALEIDDNRGNFYVNLADVLMVQGKMEEALSYYNLYAEKYPNHSRSYQLLGDFYFESGLYNEAEKNYEKSLLLSEDNINSIGPLAIIKERQGDFEEAERIFEAALVKASNAVDSITIYGMMINYNLHRGQIQKVIKIWEQTLKTTKNVYPPLMVSIYRVNRLYWYFLIDQADEALRIIQQEENTFTGSFKNILAYGYINYYLNKENISKAQEELARIKTYASKYGSSGNIENYYEAEVLYLIGEYEHALETYLEFKKVNTYFPKDLLEIKIANCVLNLGEIEKAKNIFNEMLKLNPYHPDAHFQLAKIMLNQNQKEEALEHLKIANEVWVNADPEYKDAQEARRLYENL